MVSTTLQSATSSTAPQCSVLCADQGADQAPKDMLALHLQKVDSGMASVTRAGS